jgi:phage I-like protein
MLDSITCLADLPEFASGEESPRSKIMLFRVGDYKHPRFGHWNITKQVLEQFIANFRSRGRVPIDFDHAPEQGGSTLAAGWITNLTLEGDELTAEVEWSDVGAEAIRKKRYLFISPTWNLAAKDETGAKIGPKLIGAGLTNRPFFPWPALSLAEQSRSGEPMLAGLVEVAAAQREEAAAELLDQVAAGDLSEEEAGQLAEDLVYAEERDLV